MSLLLAPYTNAMRLGQGFNSYTQQICVDDAVQVDPERPENILTNDGSTMRIVAETSGKPSVWSRMREIFDSEPVGHKDTKKTLADAAVLDAVAGPAEQVQLERIVPVPVDKVPNAPIADTAATEIVDEAAAKSVGSDDVSEVKDEDVVVSDTASGVIVDHETANQPSNAVPEPGAATGAVQVDSTSSAGVRPRSSSVGRKDPTQLTAIPQEAGPAKSQVGEIPPQPQKQAIGDASAPSSAPKSRATKPVSDAEIEQARLDKLEETKQEKARIAEQREYERKLMVEEREYQRKLSQEAREEERSRRLENQKEQEEIRREKREQDKARREATVKAINKAVMGQEALNLDQLAKIKAQNQFADRFDGIMKDNDDYLYDPSTSRGPSQVVTYSSRFIDKLSDVTEDMCVSGALSIKMAKVGGSGRGSFVDSDKFKQSDLNFYISVKVVNQTINFKDALAFNKMANIDINSKDFNSVYGDSFISGFIEGGEFNAIVSMKVHNKAKLLDIQASAKVALTAGPIDATADANVAIARSNLEVNTETTIQVSWSGGGYIKPREQPWNIETIMQAAARFPELVASCPQRTYAILTKYDSLRSFVALRSGPYTPIQYESAQMYTNILMDAFMTYKSLYKKLGDQIERIQNKTLEFITSSPLPGKTESSKQASGGSKLKGSAGALAAAIDITPFKASLSGISDARKQIRRQMMYIVNEVDLIERNPKVATEEDHEEPFQSPTLFETRLPLLKIPDYLRPNNKALSGKREMAKPQTEEDFQRESDEQQKFDTKNPPVYSSDLDSNLDPDEKASMEAVRHRLPGIGKQLQISAAAPKTHRTVKGASFNNLDFLFPSWKVESITIGMTSKGYVGSVQVVYTNGLILKKGLNSSGLTYKTLDNFQASERIIAAAVETGAVADVASAETGAVADAASAAEHRVLSVCLYTNYGRRLLGQATTNEIRPGGLVRKDGVEYTGVERIYSDSAFNRGGFKGFFGCFDPDPVDGGILRLGLIWGDSMASEKPDAAVATGSPTLLYDVDTASMDAAIKGYIRQRDEAIEQLKADVQKANADAHERAKQAGFNVIKFDLQRVQTERHSVSFRGNSFHIAPGEKPFLTFENGNSFTYQRDGNLVVRAANDSEVWSMNKSSSESDGVKGLIWHGEIDGNLIAWNQSGAAWSSETQNCGNGTLVLSSIAPFIEIFDAQGQRRVQYGS